MHLLLAVCRNKTTQHSAFLPAAPGFVDRADNDAVKVAITSAVADPSDES